MQTTLKKFSSCTISAFLIFMLTACAGVGAKPGEAEIRSGVIEQINATQLESNHHRGVGAVVGGIAGLGLGSLIGGGSGRDVAMVLGTVGGALAGNEVQKKHDKPIAGQQIIVRVASGVLVSVTQPTDPTLTKGQKVYIEGNGEGARVKLR
jgi:outer membrane lipoprotein SlyB